MDGTKMARPGLGGSIFLPSVLSANLPRNGHLYRSGVTLRRPCGLPSPSVEFCWSNMTQTRNNPMRHSTRVQSIGRFIVADPKVCHGKPTFRGTRVLVADVLEQVAAGLAWETIIDEWNGHLTQDAIREAVQLAREALLRHSSEFVFEPVPA